MGLKHSPFDLGRATAMLGSEEAALALYGTLKDPHCSKEGLSVILEVMHGVAGGRKLEPYCYINEPIPKYSFSTSTTIENEFFKNSDFTLHLIFSPEQKADKSCFRPDLKGHYYLDLAITLRVIGKAPDAFGGGLIVEIPIVVEYDGHSHLADEQVRKDKMRDSIIQTQGISIFRIQSPYKHNKASYQEDLKEIIDFHVTNIKCLLWNELNKFLYQVEYWNAHCDKLLVRREEHHKRLEKTIILLDNN